MPYAPRPADVGIAGGICRESVAVWRRWREDKKKPAGLGVRLAGWDSMIWNF